MSGDCPNLSALYTSDVSVALALAVRARTHFRARVMHGDSSMWISTSLGSSSHFGATVLHEDCLACREEFGPARPFKV